MASKQRIQELRITRTGTQRQRSLCGGTVIGDYVDQATGERVLNVKTVAHAQDKPRKFKARKTDPTIAFGTLLQRFQAEVAAKPCKVQFAWVSDTVAMLGKNADILTVRPVHSAALP